MSPNTEEGSSIKRSVRGRGGRARDILQAARQYKSGDLEAFYQTLTVSTFRNSHLSVSLANPSLPDCPLVGVSHGFEQMTGFTRCESLGKNCRFLNRGCPMSAEVRHELRTATKTHRRFVNVLVNRRRNGEVYMNLLNLSSLRVGSCMYLLAIQADVTNSDVDVQAKEQLEELDRIVGRIFAASVDVWASQQASKFTLSRLGTNISYAETRLCHRYDKSHWAAARSVFVMLISNESDCGALMRHSNTFIEVSEEAAHGSQLGRLRRVLSEPDLRVLSAKGHLVVPLDALRDALKHLPPEGDRPWPQLVVETKRYPSDGSPQPSRDGAALVDSPTTVDADGDKDALRSLGSNLHPNKCKPCSFFCYSFSGCTKGKACTYCHMDHPRRRNRRGKKKAKCASSSSSGLSQGSANSTCADTVDTLQVISPNPTHAMLMPLLDALELLSPLPVVSEFETLANSGDTACAALFANKAEIVSARGGEKGEYEEDVSLSYSESTLVLALGQWKQVVPFVGGLSRPMVFGVSPSLPQGLSLHRNSGVISGVVTSLTPSCGEAHTVTVSCRTGSTSTVVDVLVLESYERECSDGGGSGCSSDQNVNGNDNEDDDLEFEIEFTRQ